MHQPAPPCSLALLPHRELEPWIWGLCTFPAALPCPGWHQQWGHSSFHLQVLQDKHGNTTVPTKNALGSEATAAADMSPSLPGTATMPSRIKVSWYQLGTAKMTLITHTEQTPCQVWSQLCFQAWCVENLLDTKVKPLAESKSFDAEAFF